MGLRFKFPGQTRVEVKPEWSYSGFADFRNRLAAEIGITLRDMKGFQGDLQRPWDQVRDDIVPLLNHSDCDGELSPEDCAKVAPRLRELIARWSTKGYAKALTGDSRGLDYDRAHGARLAEAMERCAAAGCPLSFG